MAYAAPVPTQRARPNTGTIQQHNSMMMKTPAFMTHPRSRTFNAGSAQQPAPNYIVAPSGGLKAVEQSIPRKNSSEMYDELDDEDLQGIEEIKPSSPNVKIHKPSQAYNVNNGSPAYSPTTQVSEVLVGPPRSASKRNRDIGGERNSGNKKSKKNSPSAMKPGNVTQALGRKASITNMAAPIRSPKAINNAHMELPKTRQNIARAATQIMRFPEHLQHFETSPVTLKKDSSKTIEKIIYIDREEEEDDDERAMPEQMDHTFKEIPAAYVGKQYYDHHREEDNLEAVPTSEGVVYDEEVDALHSDVIEHDPDQTAVQHEEEQEDEGVYVGQQLPLQKAGKEVQDASAKEVAHLVLRPECKCNNCFYDPHKATKYDTQTHAEWKAEGLEYITKLSEITQEYMKLMVTRIDAFDVLVKKMDVHMEELDVAKKDAEEKKEAVRSGLPWN